MTTSYHPQCNGLIERQHRTLKDRLMSRASAASSGPASWMMHLPFVLLGLRTAVREDSHCAASDLLYGGHLRLPGDLVHPGARGPQPSAGDFADMLRSTMVAASPMPVVHHGVPPVQVDPLLQQASHVFMRVDSVRAPLVPPYDGPFRVLSRGPKTFDILWKEKPYKVSIDRLKPAFPSPPVADGPSARPRSPAGPQSPTPSPSVAVSTPPPTAVPRAPTPLYSEVAAGSARSTRSGRIPRPVARYQA